MASSARTIIPIEATFKFPFGDQTGRVNAYLIVDDGEAALIDTMTAGNEKLVEKSLEQAGLDWSALKYIFITHAHPDHAGSLKAVVAASSGVTVYSGEEDLPVDFVRVADGDNFFGLDVIGTPGHTPGSITLLDSELSSAFVGDAAFHEADSPTLPPAMFTQDMHEAVESLKKLASYRFDNAYFGHGRPLNGGAATELARLGR